MAEERKYVRTENPGVDVIEESYLGGRLIERIATDVDGIVTIEDHENRYEVTYNPDGSIYAELENYPNGLRKWLRIFDDGWAKEQFFTPDGKVSRMIYRDSHGNVNYDSDDDLDAKRSNILAFTIRPKNALTL
jgi:hypothetical protein